MKLILCRPAMIFFFILFLSCQRDEVNKSESTVENVRSSFFIDKEKNSFDYKNFQLCISADRRIYYDGEQFNTFKRNRSLTGCQRNQIETP